MKTFNIETQTNDVKHFDFGSEQQKKNATRLNASRVFRFHGKHCGALPFYIANAILTAGYKYERIGSTTHKFMVIALYK